MITLIIYCFLANYSCRMNGKWETLTLIVSFWFYCKYIKWQDTLYWNCIRHDCIRRYHVLIVDPVYVMWYPPRNIPIYVTVLQGWWLGDHKIEATVSCIKWLDAYRVEWPNLEGVEQCMLYVVCYHKVIFSIYFMYIYIRCKMMLHVFISASIDIVFVGGYRNDWIIILKLCFHIYNFIFVIKWLISLYYEYFILL